MAALNFLIVMLLAVVGVFAFYKWTLKHKKKNTW